MELLGKKRWSSIVGIDALMIGVALGLAIVATACAPLSTRGGPPARPTGATARLLGSWAAWAGSLPAFDGLRVGSLSALAFDAGSGRYLAAPDDTRDQRIFSLEIRPGPTLHITPVGVTRLSVGPSLPADVLVAFDIEGLVLMPDGSLALAHEGHIDRQGIARQPRIVLADARGVLTAVVHPRPRFAIDPADRSRGVRHNLGLESLTRTPDGRLLSGTEQPLAQDGPITSATRGGVVRIVEFVQSDAGWGTGREWAYPLDPTPRVDGYGAACEDGENGLSEMLAISTTTFLAIERACLLGAPGAPAFNPVRVYEASVAGADDVSALDSLSGRRPRVVRKRLVVDLMAWRGRLPDALATLSNFEGLAFGPPGPNGAATVMMLSDDNFRPTQTTAFVWFALPGR